MPTTVIALITTGKKSQHLEGDIAFQNDCVNDLECISRRWRANNRRESNPEVPGVAFISQQLFTSSVVVDQRKVYQWKLNMLQTSPPSLVLGNEHWGTPGNEMCVVDWKRL